jgi:hypothetical protein
VDRHNSLSGGDTRYTTQLVVSQRPGQEDKCPRMGMLDPLLIWKSDRSVKNGALLYKQLIRPMMDYVCPAWRSAAPTHVRKLQVLQSKFLRLATGAQWYVSIWQIHKDLGVPLFSDRIRALTASSDSKLTGVGNPRVRQISRFVRRKRVDPSPDAKVIGGRRQRDSRDHHPR